MAQLSNRDLRSSEREPLTSSFESVPLSVIQTVSGQYVIVSGNILLLLKDVEARLSVLETQILDLNLDSVICSSCQPQTCFPPGYLVHLDKLYYFSNSAVSLRGNLKSLSFPQNPISLEVAYLAKKQARSHSSVFESEDENDKHQGVTAKLLHEQAPILSIEEAFQVRGKALVHGSQKFRLRDYPFLATLQDNQLLVRLFPDSYSLEVQPLELCGIVCISDARRKYDRPEMEKYDFLGIFDYNLSKLDIFDIPVGCFSRFWNLDAASSVGSGSQIFIPFLEPTEKADFLVIDNSQVFNSGDGFDSTANMFGLRVARNGQDPKFILVKDFKKPPRSQDEAVKSAHFFTIGKRQIFFVGYETHYRVSLGASDAIIQVPNAYWPANYYVLGNCILDDCVYIPVLLAGQGGSRCLKVIKVNLAEEKLIIFSADFEKSWGLPIFWAVDRENQHTFVSKNGSEVTVLTTKLH